MKIGGKVRKGPNVITRVFPRENDDPIVFKIQAVLDMDEFEKNYPQPEPPTIVDKKNNKRKDLNDKKYLAKLDEHGTWRFNYMILKSLAATDGLEWETVNMDDPTTWKNYRNDLRGAGLSTAEQNKLISDVVDANGISDEKLKEARDAFLRSQAQEQSEQSSLKEEPSNTESGEPANDSE